MSNKLILSAIPADDLVTKTELKQALSLIYEALDTAGANKQAIEKLKALQVSNILDPLEAELKIKAKEIAKQAEKLETDALKELLKEEARQLQSKKLKKLFSDTESDLNMEAIKQVFSQMEADLNDQITEAALTLGNIIQRLEEAKKTDEVFSEAVKELTEQAYAEALEALKKLS